MRQFGTAVLATVILLILTTSQAHADLIPKLEWIRTYDSPCTNDANYKDRDCGKGIALDAAGNIYVTGSEYRKDLGQGHNIWVRKYDTNGNTLWTQTYDSPAHGPDLGLGVAVDAAGNLYVTGSENRRDLGQKSNIWLRKYDADGNALWTRTYDGSTHRSDGGFSVAVDSAGNVYVCGSIEMDTKNVKDWSSNLNVWLGKYDTDGNLLWTRTYDNPSDVWPYADEAYGVALDALGNIYVTGREHRKDLGQDSNIWVRRYDASGKVLWTDTYNGSANRGDYGYGVAVDTAGNAYVVGTAKEGTTIRNCSNDIWVRKYDTDGNIVWTDTYDSPAHGGDIGWGVAVDAVGNAYVTGRENRTNLFLRKYDPDGNTLWTLSYNGEAVGTAEFAGYGIALDNAGNIYVTGKVRYWGSDQHDDIIVLKFSQVPKPPDPSTPIIPTIPIFRPPGIFVQQAVAAFLLLVAVFLGIVRVLRKRLR